MVIALFKKHVDVHHFPTKKERDLSRKMTEKAMLIKAIGDCCVLFADSIIRILIGTGAVHLSDKATQPGGDCDTDQCIDYWERNRQWLSILIYSYCAMRPILIVLAIIKRKWA